MGTSSYCPSYEKVNGIAATAADISKSSQIE